MAGEDSIISVHSVAEAYLYLMATPCPDCARGPLRQQGDLTKGGAGPGGWTLAARCAACGEGRTLRFDIHPPPTREEARSSRINPTAEASRAIDLPGWLTLFQTILAASGRESDRRTGRQLAVEAAQCLDEALKFYDVDQELPGPEAFFSDDARRRFEAHPQQFARSKWLERRLRLPAVDANTRATPPEARRPWWRFWRRR